MSAVITAVVCSSGITPTLTRTLRSLKEQTLPKDSYQVLVVDNSRDGSVDPGPFEKIAEPTEGLSRARNTGWKSAYSDYIAFIDDDAVAAPDWLAALLTAFRQSKHIGMAGGPVYPEWPGPKPDWISPPLFECLSLLDLGDRTHVLNDTANHLIGTNMAFSRSALEAAGGFDPRLGRRDSQLLSGEETLAAALIRRAGFTIHYEPRAAVTHIIDVQRLTHPWFLRRFEWNGRTAAVLEKILARPNSKQTARPLASLLKLLDLANPSPRRRFIAQCRLASVRGYLQQKKCPLENRQD